MSIDKDAAPQSCSRRLTHGVFADASTRKRACLTFEQASLYGANVGFALAWRCSVACPASRLSRRRRPSIGAPTSTITFANLPTKRHQTAASDAKECQQT